eukprot:CAMPEP_0198296554 /NCGR_PEP_ID=MMETSP1449-20131203/33042_1 /TAXON_ID=420275 /ORGANISM="Attheya septentrionalis, Strain CCMP2084" /LENGTH=308 /DNA_ID=CAMNT_0043997203 /DNA_START=138 /DNA_END=1064 /DNA_ORIENTATION=+
MNQRFQIYQATEQPIRITKPESSANDDSPRPSITQIIAASFIPMSPENGKMKLPRTIHTVVIDIGARESDYLDVLEQTEDATVALILFDPLPDSSIPLQKRVAEYSMRGLNETRSRWLNQTRSRQVFMVRAAMGENEGIGDFNIARGPACSSILKTSSENKFWCANVKETIQIPIMTLKDFLPLIPESVEQIHIKVDTEGADLAVLRGAGDYIHKVNTFVIECKADGGDKKFRDGECVQSDASLYMKEKDFNELEVERQGGLVNMFFVNSKYKGPLPAFLKDGRLAMRGFYDKLYQRFKNDHGVSAER